MNYDYFLGVDPGKEGAYVLLGADANFKVFGKFPVVSVGTKKEHNPAALQKNLKVICEGYKNTLVVLEKVGAMRLQGVTSTCSLCYGFGLLVGIFASLDQPVKQVAPQQWKKDLMYGMPKGKDSSVLVAARLFPKTSDILYNKRGTPDHNIADAMLLAEWGRRWSNSNPE